MFHSTLLVQVEGVMTMIRAIKTDHDLDPECSLLGLHVVLDIIYMRKDSNLGCYKCFGCFNDIFIGFLLSSCCGYMALLANLSVF